jgi:predicted dehydrogenase
MDETLAPVNWGVLGTADIALKKVIPAMHGSDLSVAAAIASRSEAKARQAAEAAGIPRWHGSYEDLLADRDIEAVYIPLPNHLHLEWAIAAAHAGKHVLCEKPLALSSADARSMADACSEAGVLLMEAFMYRLHPMWVETMSLIESGGIGDVRAVQCVFSYFNDDPSNIRNIPEYGGGALYDIGCYAVNMSRMVLGGEPTGVKATASRDDRLGTDVLTSAVLDFGGRIASFTCSTQMEPDQRVVIYGSEGRLVVDIPFNIPPDRPTRISRIAGGSPPVAPDVEVHEVPPANPYTVQADLFSRAIRTGTDSPIDPADAVANLEVIERIFADADG